MKISFFHYGSAIQTFAAAALVSLAANGVSLAQSSTAATAAVGLTTVTCLGASDTLVSTPLDRVPVYVGNGAPSTSDGVTKIVFADAAFTASQFKFVAATQSNTYFARVASGAKAGRFYTITDNDAVSITLNLAGDDLSAVTGAVSVAIIPYWTLGTLFPNGSGVTATSRQKAGTDILIPDTTSAGINLDPPAAYYYSSKANCWYSETKAKNSNNVVLYPDNYFIVRNIARIDTSFTVYGAVVTTSVAIPLTTNAEGQQDNSVALTRPIPVSLKDSGLIGSGAFAAASGSTAGDQLLIYDNTTVSYNKPPAAVYTYTNGAWQKDGNSGDAGDDAVFTPGSGVIIRKQATPAGMSVIWVNSPNY